MIGVRDVLDVDGNNIGHKVTHGDVLLEVDGVRVEHLPKRSLHRKMAGEIGTVVHLRFCAGPAPHQPSLPPAAAASVQARARVRARVVRRKVCRVGSRELDGDCAA